MGPRNGIRFNYYKDGSRKHLVLSHEKHMEIKAILKTKADERTAVRINQGKMFHCGSHIKARTEDLRQILLADFNIVTDEMSPVHLVKFEI